MKKLSIFILLFFLLAGLAFSKIYRADEVFPVSSSSGSNSASGSTIAQSGSRFSYSDIVEIFCEELKKDTYTNLVIDYEADKSTGWGSWQVNVYTDGYNTWDKHVGEVSIYLRVNGGYLAFRTFEQPSSIRDGLKSTFYMYNEQEFGKTTDETFVNFFRESFIWAKRNGKSYKRDEIIAFNKLVAYFYPDKKSLLMLMADRNVDTAVRQICDTYGGINTQDTDGWTALMYAASKNSLDSARILLSENADISIKNKKGQTALAIASGKNYTEMVRLLKERQLQNEQAEKEHQKQLAQQEKERKEKAAKKEQLEQQVKKNLPLKSYYDALKADMDAETKRETEQLQKWRDELH